MPIHRFSPATSSRPFASLLSVCLAIVCYSANLQAADEPSKTPSLHAAFVDKDITPELGMERPGGYGKSYLNSIHDPCKARIGVFRGGDSADATTVVVVSLDALVIRKPQVAAMRRRIEEQTGIPAGHILVHATHSHSSGPTGMVLPGEYDHASEFVQELAYEKSSMANAEYLITVENQVVEGVVEAWKNLAPGHFNVDRGHEASVSFNRRFHMKSGLTVTHPGKMNPEIVNSAGPIDPEVGVLGVWNEQGKLTGCIINFVCHATTNPGGFSANYIYYVEKVVRGMFGDEVVVVFLAGASGDVTQVDNVAKQVPKKGEGMAALVGGRVGAEAVKVLLGMDRGNVCPLDARQQILSIPRRKIHPLHLEVAKEQAAMSPKEMDPTDWTFAKETVLLDALAQVSPVVEVEIQAVQIGPLAIVTVPAEYFCQYGLDIKKGSRFPFTFVASLSNGCVGYVPTLEAFGANGGGYETRLSSYSNLEITAGDTMASTCIALTKQLTPGEVPTGVPTPDFKGKAWRYGDVPPQVD